MQKIPIGLQLYSVREECARDFAGALAAVAEMGYDGVEFAGYYDLPARELRRILDDTGLKAAGTHIGIDALLGDELEKTIEYNAILGNRFLIVPGLPPEYTADTEAWKRSARLFDQIADRLEPHGMYTGLHNHSGEFIEHNGTVPYALFFASTSERVCLQPDIGNALAGGVDILPYVEQFAGRSRTVHLKEFSSTNAKALIGEGDVNWTRCFEICESSGGTEWYIVEQESYPVSPMESIRQCLLNLRRLRSA